MNSFLHYFLLPFDAIIIVEFGHCFWVLCWLITWLFHFPFVYRDYKNTRRNISGNFQQFFPFQGKSPFSNKTNKIFRK